MNIYFEAQTEVVVKGLMKYRGMDRYKAVETWMKSQTRNLIQNKYNLTHISGARCYDELIMELDSNPYWMKGQFD